jgi:hypothetical protein
MRRPFVISTGALALALLPAALFAQTPAAQTPPAQTPAAPATQAPAAPAQPAAPALAFTGNAGLLLVQIKPDQTAAFEELITKLKAALAATSDAALKAQGASFKVYKSAEGMQSNALYVIVADPATPNVEYYPLQLLAKAMTDDEKRAPETQAMFKKYAEVFAGVNKLNLSPVGGGM